MAPKMRDGIPMGRASGRRVQDYVYDRIKSMILEGTLANGELLSEGILAEQLSVSRTPIREALTRLEGEWLVEIVPHHGACVRRLSLRDIHEFFEIRMALETWLAREAVESLDQDEVENLLTQLKRMLEKADSVTVDEIAELGLKVHGLFWGATGNRRIQALILNLREQFRMVGKIYADRHGGVHWERSRLMLQQKVKILEAVLSRDVNAVANEIVVDLENARAFMKDILPN